MSGHSKWSKIKHQKAATDKAKGKVFTKLGSAIAIAVREGGGSTDPDSNFKLRLAIEKAKSLNMPKVNIEKAILRGGGAGEIDKLEKIVYEAFGPKGIGIIIETATDNKQRTVAEVKNVLDKNGGVFAAKGAVSHMFNLVGLINIAKEGKSTDEIMELVLEAGAEDLEDLKDSFDVFTKPVDLHKVRDFIEKSGVKVTSFELFYRPQTTIPITDSKDAEKILRLLSNLEDIDDVQKVSANFDIPDELMK